MREASKPTSVLLLPWRFLYWRVAVTLRLFRAIGRHPLWVLGGALIGYLALIPLVLPVMVGLDMAGVRYSDEQAAWVVAVIVFFMLNAGGFLGYRIGERRKR